MPPVKKKARRLESRTSSVTAVLSDSPLLQQQHPIRGRTLVASRDVKEGTVLMTESPLVQASLPGHASLEPRCPHCLAPGPLACCTKPTDALDDSEFFRWASKYDPFQVLAAKLLALCGTAPLQEYASVKWPDAQPWDGESDEGEFRKGVTDRLEYGRSLLGEHMEVCGEVEWQKMVGLIGVNAASVLPGCPVRNGWEAMIERACKIAKAGEGMGNEGEGIEAAAKEVEKMRDAWVVEWGDDQGDGQVEWEEEEDDSEEVEEEEEEEEVSDEEGGEASDEGGEASDEEGWLDLPPDHALTPTITSLVETFNSLPPPESTALYPALSVMNHSCCPNAEIRFDDSNNVAFTVATRDIKKGEEVCHSYVSLEELPGRKERQERLLVQHGFTCTCELCESTLE